MIKNLGYNNNRKRDGKLITGMNEHSLSHG